MTYPGLQGGQGSPPRQFGPVPRSDLVASGQQAQLIVVPKVTQNRFFVVVVVHQRAGFKYRIAAWSASGVPIWWSASTLYPRT